MYYTTSYSLLKSQDQLIFLPPPLPLFFLTFHVFHCRKNELHLVAQQASNIEELTEVIQASLSVMSKQWSDAMHTFHEKFDSLSNLIIDHGNATNIWGKLKQTLFMYLFAFLFNSLLPVFFIGLDSSPQEEFLSLLGGARTSPPVHQFLVSSLGEMVCLSLYKFSP